MGYQLIVSYASESGFTIITPDRRHCDVRFSHDFLERSNFSGLGPEEILSQSDFHIDRNLLHNNDCPSTRLSPKYYPSQKGITRFEYQVICQCFAEATGTVMQWNDETMWRENLGPFREWMIDNRHRFQTDSNIKLVNDCIWDKDFPRSNNVRCFLLNLLNALNFVSD